MKSVQTGVLLLCFLLAQSDAVKRSCFARFDLVSGRCEEELDMLEEDDCCQNPHYGFIDADGFCQFCGVSTWTGWSSWSQCSQLCGSGVVQRTRRCHGLSECPGDQTDVQMKPCESSDCCPAAEWKDWGAWSPCAVSCGVGVQGQRQRKRVCSHLTAGCELTCVGPKHQTEACVGNQPCPVHGGWDKWTGWTPCSDTCIPGPFHADQLGVYPTRRRNRTCSNPAPSQDTRPAGNDCQGSREEVQSCSELPNCPVDGGWGAWRPSGACPVSYGKGLQLLIRLCDSPAPQYGGQYCVGTNTKSAVCGSTCPVHGVWAGWSVWGECSASCHSSRPSVRSRERSCSNPAPSSQPKGNDCQGQPRESRKCDELPNCPVDGGWSSWDAFSGCSVTCGVGRRGSVRICNTPAPQHGGKPCPGTPSRTITCTTNIHCPINGMWTEWSDWGPCERAERCEDVSGIQRRTRSCLNQDFGGTPCPVGKLSERRGCYDITNCVLPAAGWAGWSEWTLCLPVRNKKIMSWREMICEADLDYFSSTGGRFSLPMSFYGTPTPFCGVKKRETKECVNIPPNEP